ncbi:hypothetical protein P3X46_001294 [Hevea brasiliensis]|uniref:Glycosyltransferase n=1 Tax=Hevea brasiliensis TaxID=3981 RepID=A0ABQ9NG42_HEVBR|nr:putative UDP-rhamnose:rhamnosyltransferase 1 [Hevea brasiliensis]KAJ9190060.1 hypothetical protein P3X46_001294 [Hevea brasiliensis]
MSEAKKLHVALFPWLAFGHMIPFFELAKLIAQRGHKISFISTPRNIQRLPKIPPNLAPLINLVSLPLPTVEHLPQNAEATTDIPSHKTPYLKIAFDGLQGPLHQFFQTSTPDWIIYDFAPYWLPPILANLGISGVFFSMYGAWTLSFFGSSTSAMINGEDPRTRPEDFTVPPEWIPFPSKIAFGLHEAKRAFGDHIEVNNSGFSDVFRLGSVVGGCNVIAIRNCNELESNFSRLVGELHCKPVVPIGLLPPADFVGSSDQDDMWLTIKEWLDKQNKGSVVYIAFGSESKLSQPELHELALGLELSGLPFFWALRKRENSVKLPVGFEERVKGRGTVWTSWVPQLKIMGHESVGGFLTHCGYASIIEAFYFELPLIMMPISIDQGLIARFFGEKMVGIEITKDEKDGSLRRESVAESLRLIMVEKEGRGYRDKAKEMKKLIADKDMHDRYVDHFVEFMQNHRVA